MAKYNGMTGDITGRPDFSAAPLPAPANQLMWSPMENGAQDGTCSSCGFIKCECPKTPREKPNSHGLFCDCSECFEHWERVKRDG